MKTRIINTLAQERERLGWSQARMAEAAGVSRQSYAAIEAGRSVPSTEVALRLAAALGRTVGELFRLVDARGERRNAAWAGAGPAMAGTRVRLCRVGGRWIAHPCAEAHRRDEPADGVVEAVEGDDVAVRLLPHGPPPAELVVAGCDPAFGILAETLRREHGVEVCWVQRGSRAALLALARGHVHVAGTHLRDPASGAWNGPWVRELVPFPCTRISFATWKQGLIVRPGASPRIRGVADLARRGVRLLNREEGSGSRALLDEVLAAAGVVPARVAGYATAARGHLAVADAIAAGAADAGVAIVAAARARGLEAIPLREEAYELVIPDHFLELPAVDALLRLLRRPTIRAQIEALDGYDAAAMGAVAS